MKIAKVFCGTFFNDFHVKKVLQSDAEGNKIMAGQELRYYVAGEHGKSCGLKYFF